MRWTDIYIAGTGSWLANEVDVDSAIVQGRYDHDEADKSGQLALTVADAGQHAPDMAVHAALQAIKRSGHGPDDVGMLLYAVLMHAGIDVWSSASYLQNQVTTNNCFVSEVRCGSNGGLVGLEMACDHLVARPGHPAAIVTAADCWPDPVFDRWRADSGLVFGDGGSAVVVSRAAGFARLVSMNTTADSSLEGLHRGEEEFGPFRHNAEYPIDLYRRAQEFMREVDRDEVWRRHNAGLRTCFDRTLAEAGIGIEDIDHVVVPFFGRALLERQCLTPLGIDIDRTTWEFGRSVGHLGAGDQLAGLNWLVESGRLEPGQRILLIGIGGGFTWTCALIEIIEEVRWLSEY